MSEIQQRIVIGDSFFGTWVYVDDIGEPIEITQSMEFSSSIELNGNKYPVTLDVLDQTLYRGQIAFFVETNDWERGHAEMDILAVSGIYKKHSPKYCFVVVGGVTP
ncbi:hypothetical protein [Acinetobacter venetianus]|uniref:Uncharacterized protein n=1 Tax=Acinetobacter venetianus TaxID=52133 RepID=A0A150HQB7_9GAMM|nr:hypothetical protein [Acinetobacter venetianus]KXZ68751.1 hypothetical protein AVENLUH13518_02911 [Acinetobacter venetianus]